jgi:hypothetical protein
MLETEVTEAQRLVKTDAYQMSIGEIVSMYVNDELVIDPEFQRLFRWKIGQKSKLIESLLLGIPIPSIFVFEKDDSKWELIDGLQRISTILEFMGLLRDADGNRLPPSALEATRYLPSLHNVVWDVNGAVIGVEPEDQVSLEKGHQLAIRRSRISVEILKRPSENKTKFDLFQRLNAGGTEANPQELRNCIIIMVSATYFRAVKACAEGPVFQTMIGLREDQAQRQRHLEYASRFLVHALVPYDGKLDVEEFIDEGVVQLATANQYQRDAATFVSTFQLIHDAAGENALKRHEGGRPTGRVTLGAFESIAVGVGRNLARIQALPDPVAFVLQRISEYWDRPELVTFASPGLRGTTRIQRTVDFGDRWFRP